MEFLNKNKYFLIIILFLGFALFVSWRNNVNKTKQLLVAYSNPKIVFKQGKERVVFKDRVINRLITRTIEKDGKMVEIIKEKEVDKSKEGEKEVIEEKKEPVLPPISPAKQWLITATYFLSKDIELAVQHKFISNFYLGINVGTNLQFSSVKFGLTASLLF